MMIAVVAAGAYAQTPVKSFIPVQGTTLQEKLDAASKAAKPNAQLPRFWSAYGFDVRPGVAIDVQVVNDDGSVYVLNGNGVSVGDRQIETRSLGVFILRNQQSGAIDRVDIYNLEREHEYSGYPVYWLGHVSNDESLAFLKNLAMSDQVSNEGERIAESAALALAVHDDHRVPSVLIELARSAKSRTAQLSAIRWLARTGGGTSVASFLTDLARNASADIEFREQAIRSLGRLKEPAVLGVMTSMYTTLDDNRLKRQIIASVGANEDRKSAARFLLGVASDGADSEQKRNAMIQLALIATRHDGAFDRRSDPETAIQREAVVAISRRDKEDAIPILVNIARTHPKDEVRRQAMLSLGRIGDDRAIAFFRETLTK
jgi:HEAT repeat protein